MKILKKEIFKFIIKFVILIAVFFVITAFFFENPYANWFLNSKYSLPEVKITQEVMDDGQVKVHEQITYEMRKPFRGVYRHQPGGRRTEYTDLKIWIDGVDEKYIEYLQNNIWGFEFRVWMVPYNSYNELSPDELKTFTLNVTYTVSNLIEYGENISQIFWKAWGDEWDAPIKSFESTFVFPENYSIRDIYGHPSIDYNQNRNIYTFKTTNFPPEAFIETRFVFNDSIKAPYTVQNTDVTLANIEKEENKYSSSVNFKSIFPIIFYLVLLVITILIFIFMGKEMKIDYNALYEREIPYKDSPDIVNALTRMSTMVSNDGISAVIMNLYRKNYIDVETDGKSSTIKVLKKEPGNDLFQSEKKFLRILDKYSYQGIFDFDVVKREVAASKSSGQIYTSYYNSYTATVRSECLNKKYFGDKGYVFSIFIAIVFLVSSFALGFYISASPTQNMLYYGIAIQLSFWLTGAVVFSLPKIIFAKWTKQGRLYSMKWNNYKRFLEDYSLLKEYPPESIIIWEEYLVYATALGIADKVLKSLKKIVPEDIIQQSGHSYMYVPYWYVMGTGFRTLHTSAYAAAHPSSSGSGGGGFGAGGAGGGAGGGGGGAF